jgi:hypothetical protein
MSLRINHWNAEAFEDDMTAYGLDVVGEAERVLRQQIIGAVAAVVAIAAFAGFAALF